MTQEELKNYCNLCYNHLEKLQFEEIRSIYEGV